MSYITAYYPSNPNHEKGFVDLLREQGKAHGHNITDDHAHVVANQIGREFQVSLLCEEDKIDGARGMTTTTDADFAEGRFLFLEDLIVAESARGKGYGRKLLDKTLIDAWEGEKTGLALETGRHNKPARETYLKIDPSFDAANLHDVWEVSPEQCAAMATGNSYAKLATRQDLDAIASTLANQPDRNLGYVSRILQKQEEQPEENRRESGSFVVVANNGSSNNSVFAIASDAYSTFDGCMRTDVRIYLPEVFSALPSKTRKSQMTALMRGVSKEVANRKWRGPVHIEFANNTNGLDNDDMAVEKKKVAAATAVLKELGGKPLIHSGDPMVPLILSGKRYVVAVIRAAENSPQQPLGSTAQKRLKEAARRYGLEYSPAA